MMRMKAVGRFGSRAWLPMILGAVLVLAGCAKSSPAVPTATPAGAAPTSAVQSMLVATTAAAPSLAPALEAASATPSHTPTRQPPSPVLPTETPSPTATRQLPSPVPPTETPSEPATAAVSLSPLKPDAAQIPPLALQRIAGGLDRPLFVTHAGDGSNRLFIVEKPGIIRIFVNGSLVAKPFLDLRDRVNSGSSERGLLGLAFPPDYVQRGYFFVDYIDRAGDTVVSRFKVTGDPNVADPASEFKVLGIRQPAANHNGGMLAFGPDGYLYIGTGDGGGEYDRFGNGQNPNTLLAKILRLDVTSDPSKPYQIPPDNPWVSADWNGKKVPGEAWAVGLRNPWRFSFDRRTGDLWIADVGQDKYEEIDLVRALDGKKLTGGLNFGWSIMEGMHCFPDSANCQKQGLTLPIAEYDHGQGCSITGGYVYRGSQYPALDGTYFYGDYCSGTIWALRPNGSGWRSTPVLDTGLAISSFGEDQAGELYVTDLNGGAVYRLVQK
jgi:glucose/arabinose dehydrogenase